MQRLEYLLEGVPDNELYAAFEKSLSGDDSKLSVDTDQVDKSQGIDSGSDEARTFGRRYCGLAK